jgi:hypothetical protein
MRAAAGVAGALALSDVWIPLTAHAQTSGAPMPIPKGGIPGAPFRVYLPGSGQQPATITDFRGAVGVAALGGSGTGTDTTTGATMKLLSDIDVRFMKGIYTGADGMTHAGTFGFI